MEQPTNYEHGSQVVYREIWRGRIWTARPVTVVQDRPDLVVLYIGSGTQWKLPAPLDGATNLLHCKLTGRWRLADALWTWGDTLYWMRPAESHAVHVMWKHGSREFAGWYINLQEPVRRTKLGFDFMDHDLDIVVKPDLSQWRWKDEDDLQAGLDSGVYTAQQALDIRAEGERVVERILNRASPFDNGWLDWTPDAGWSVPVLPTGWDQL